MHDAYEVVPVLERLPLNIESITCFGEEGHKYQTDASQSSLSSIHHKNEVTLLVGTKPGHLLVYKVKRMLGTTASQAEVALEKSNRSFSKRPIQQLYVSPELKVLISLSDALVSVHDTETFQLIATIQRTKGAVMFAADLEEQISSTGDAAYALKLCVVMKRKLQFYFWKNRDFVELHDDVSLPEVPKCLAWCRDSVCLGFRREYSLVKLNENEALKELFPTGKLMEPVIGRMGGDQLVLMRDDMSLFVNCNGETTYKLSFPWSENPMSVEFQFPYLVAALPRYVEIRTVEPRLLIQSIDFVKARIFTCWRDWLFVSSSTHVWLLQQRPISLQVKQLLDAREFELALKLARMSTDEDNTLKEKHVREIRTSLAFELFRQKRFQESLINFANLKTDVSQVIGLFPDLLPVSYQRLLVYPSPPPKLHGQELEEGLHALIEMLTQKRNELQKVEGLNIEESHPIMRENNTLTSKSQLLQIIDTTLLKCYLKTNDALVAPLLRLPDNNCHIEEAERVLKKAHKYRELTELYRSRGLHGKALNLLLHQSETQDNKTELYEDMIEYLQHMGRDHIELILQFAPTLLKVDPLKGLKIFTGDTAAVESLPKNQVLDFLQSISLNLVVAYLEHVVLVLEDETTEFHNRLADAYKDMVVSMLRQFNHNLPEDDQLLIEQAPMEMMEARKKLLAFLECSRFYQAERILPGFPQELIEERALLLGRMGSHEKALSLYISSLNDSEKAERFAMKVHQQNPNENKDVFLALFRIILRSSYDDSSVKDLADVINPALLILQRHASKIDPEKALSELPSSLDVASVDAFLHHVIEAQSEKRRQLEVLHNLLLSENEQAHEQRIHHEKKKYLMSDESMCGDCKKKMGNSAFVRYSDDIIVHYSCCKERKFQPLLPQTG